MDQTQALKICTICQAQCCKMGGTDFDEQERALVLQNGFSDKMIKIAENHYEAVCTDGKCSYLNDDNSCSIHDVRPKLCRRFPVFSSIIDGKRKRVIVHCPIMSLVQTDEIKVLVDIDEHISDIFIKESISNSNVLLSEEILERIRLFEEHDLL